MQVHRAKPWTQRLAEIFCFRRKWRNHIYSIRTDLGVAWNGIYNQKQLHFLKLVKNKHLERRIVCGTMIYEKDFMSWKKTCVTAWALHHWGLRRAVLHSKSLAGRDENSSSYCWTSLHWSDGMVHILCFIPAVWSCD